MAENKPQRLDKAVSFACNISRADAIKCIRRGLVQIDGEIVKKPEQKADYGKCTITLDGKDYHYNEYLYIMMNKPEDTVCISADKPDSVLNTLPDELFRRDLFTVGRLDKDTTGLLIITNDGGFAHKIISPKKHINKVYLAFLEKPLTDDMKTKLMNGVTLADGDFVKAIAVEFADETQNHVHITIDTGKYHQVKRMFAAIGNHVTKLSRLQIGALKLDKTLETGSCRMLTDSEQDMIFVQNI